MKYSVIAAMVAASLGLTGCGQSEQSQQQTQVEKKNTQTQGKAELGTFGVDLSAMDKSVDPGEDFFRYASGNWYDNYELPADKTRFGAFTALRDRSQEQVKTIIDDIMAKKDLNAEEQMIHDYYTAYMDVESINQKKLLWTHL